MIKENFKNFGTLGDYIRYLRKSLDITMSDLSKTSTVSQPYLSLLENNKNNPSDEVLEKISFGVSELSDGIKSEEVYNILKDAREHYRVSTILNLASEANRKSKINARIRQADETLNLNYILDYFERKNKIAENFEKRKRGEFIDTIDIFHNYNIILDDEKLTDEEINMLRVLIIGLKEEKSSEDDK